MTSSVKRVVIASVTFVSVVAFGSADATEKGQSNGVATLVEAADGEALFQQRCMACHQMKGEGIPGLYPPLAKSPIVNGSVATPIRIVLHGLQGPIVVNGKKFNGMMPPFGVNVPMTDAEVAVVLSYVRQSFGNASSPVSEADVATHRTATANRTTPWTAKELGIP